MATSPQHQAAKKNMTKTEFKLFTESFPKQLQTLSRRRVQSALKRTEELVEKYRRSLMSSNKKNMRTLNFRIRNLEKSLNRYAKTLKKNEDKQTTESRAERRSLTGQSKLRLNRRGDSTRDFRYEERQHIYDMRPEQPRSVTAKPTRRRR